MMKSRRGVDSRLGRNRSPSLCTRTRVPWVSIQGLVGVILWALLVGLTPASALAGQPGLEAVHGSQVLQALHRAYREGGAAGAMAWYEEVRGESDEPLGLPLPSLLALGRDAFQGGYIGDAVLLLELTTREHPEAPPSWLEYGTALLYDHRPQAARQAFETAVSMAPEEPGLRVFYLDLFDARREDAERETRAPREFRPGALTGLTGPYLGQAPPGDTPEVFAPGIVSLVGRPEVHLSFSPDGEEMYLSARGEGLLVSRMTPEGWNAPAPLPDEEIGGYSEINVAPDGARLWGNKDRSVWSLTPGPEGWGNPVLRFPGGMFASQSLDGTVYFTQNGPQGGQVVRSRFRDGEYEDPEPLSGGLASSSVTAHPFISPDGTLLLFDSPRAGGFGGFDLWASKREGDGSWGEAVNLGSEVNSLGQNMCAYLSADGRYLFFTRFGDIWWVRADILDDLSDSEDGNGGSIAGADGMLPGQAEPPWEEMTGLETGPAAVGFSLAEAVDSTRMGPSVDAAGARKIRMWIWYPAVAGTGHRLVLADYLGLAAEDFPDGHDAAPTARAWIRKTLIEHGLPEGRFPDRLATPMLARDDADSAPGPHPLVILGQGLFYESPLSQLVLSEYLASHGFVVATVPLKGLRGSNVNLTVEDFQAQIQDLEFLLSQVPQRLKVAVEGIAAMGFDLGGMAALVLQAKRPSIRALVSLDSGIIFSHNLALLDATPGFGGDGLSVPTLHFTRMPEENRAIGVEEDLELFEGATTEEVYLVRLPGMRHPDFTSFLSFATGPANLPFWGMEVGDPGQASVEMAGIIRDFLLGFLEDDASALKAFRNRVPAWKSLDAEAVRDSDLPEIRQVIHNSIAWALTKNKALLDSCFTHEGDLLILNPNHFEPDRGFEPLEQSWEDFWSREEFRAISFEMRNLRIKLSRSGDVAWFYTVMDDIGEWAGQDASWLNTRWTGVLEKREGRWVIVQQHFSWVPDARNQN